MSTKTRYVLRSKEDILSWRRPFKKLISESEKKKETDTICDAVLEPLPGPCYIITFCKTKTLF